MKNVCHLLLWVLLLVPVAAIAQQTKPADPPAPLPPPPPADDYFPKRWKEFSSKEGEFKVLLPGEPSVSDTTHNTPVGDIVIHTFHYKGVITQDVMYVDYAINVEDPSVVKKFFDEMRDGGIANVSQANPRIVKQTDLTVGGHPGRFLEIELAGKTIVRIKYVAVRNRVYNIVATSGKAHPGVMGSENDYQEIAMAFLDSFQLTRQ